MGRGLVSLLHFNPFPATTSSIGIPLIDIRSVETHLSLIEVAKIIALLQLWLRLIPLIG
jgi:hypothetical protein